MSTRRVATSSVAETRRVATALAELLRPGMVVVLVGSLGAGKTAFAQGLGAGLGVLDRVTSPTFTMVASHRADGRRGIALFLHADLYRVGSGVEADDLAIGELVEEGAIAAVEWGDLAPDVLGPHRVLVHLEPGRRADDRVLTLSSDELDLDALVLPAHLRGTA